MMKLPSMAIVLSVVVLGSGQIYNGEAAKGLLAGMLQVMFLIAGSEVHAGWYAPALIVSVWAIHDAYATAKRINASRWGESWNSLLS